jgi:hypothetical protein
MTMKGRLPGPALEPTVFKMNCVEMAVFTANQPTCSNPISRPGIT